MGASSTVRHNRSFASGPGIALEDRPKHGDKGYWCGAFAVAGFLANGSSVTVFRQ